MKKVFLDNLPRKNNGTSDRIDWQKSIGSKVSFIFDDIDGEFYIDEMVDKEHIVVTYNNSKHTITKTALRKGNVVSLLGEYKYEIGKHIKDSKRDFIITDREKRAKIISGNVGNVPWYKFNCNKCGWTEGWIQGTYIKQGKGCACCAGKTVVHGINDITTVAPWMIKYFQGGYDEAKQYTKSAQTKIIFKCPDCHNIKDKPIRIDTLYREEGIGCHCGDGITYPEKFMYNLLRQLNIDFTTQKRFDWIKDKKYDFYLNNHNIIIEVHGRQHYDKGFNSVGGNTLKEEQENDRLKKDAAILNDYIYVEIDARESTLEWIKESVLNSKLNTLFNLSKIDWVKCNEYALSNLLKKACDIKNENPYITTGQIAEIIGVSKGAVLRYLKIGSSYGFCEYDPNKEMKERYKRGSKPIEVFKDGVSLGTFESSEYAAIVSENVFGVKFTSNCIRSVCKGKQKTHRGYTFKYVN